MVKKMLNKMLNKNSKNQTNERLFRSCFKKHCDHVGRMFEDYTKDGDGQVAKVGDNFLKKVFQPEIRLRIMEANYQMDKALLNGHYRRAEKYLDEKLEYEKERNGKNHIEKSDPTIKKLDDCVISSCTIETKKYLRSIFDTKIISNIKELKADLNLLTI